MNEYRIKAYAKINLGLDVVRRLENGYHEVKMVMQTVGIYDVLDFIQSISLCQWFPKVFAVFLRYNGCSKYH